MSARRVEEWMAVEAERHGWDWSLKLVTGHLSCWSAELRVTPEPNRDDGPDTSLVWYAGGYDSADMAAEAAWDGVREWRRGVVQIDVPAPDRGAS